MRRRVLQFISRLLGLIVTGHWFMLCGYAHYRGWRTFTRLADRVFQPWEDRHCHRCYVRECIRLRVPFRQWRG